MQLLSDVLLSSNLTTFMCLMTEALDPQTLTKNKSIVYKKMH